MLGRYEVIRPLASGTMADLLLARARGLEGFERHVVIKRIRADSEDDEAFVEMFLVEARLAAALHHHNIVQVYDIGEENGKPYFAMEYVHGEDLRRLLTETVRKREQVPFPVIVAIVTAVARALHHAHEQRGADQQPLGIVHRDVAPANIVVGYDGNVKVLDFGIARAAMRRTKTQAGMLKGKAPYMAPEQCTGAAVDRRSDVFALGVVLYELTTARRLFKGESDFSTMSMIVNGSFPKPSTIRKDLPPELERIILRALAREPEARYQTAEQMFGALEQLAIGAEWRTSASALAAFMTQMFGSRTEPWLASEPVAAAVSGDFDGSLPGLASLPVEGDKPGVPRPVESTKSAPIARAHSDLQAGNGASTATQTPASSPIQIPEATGPKSTRTPVKPVPRVTSTPPRGRPKTVQVPVPAAKAAPKAEPAATAPAARPETKTEVGLSPEAGADTKTDVGPAPEARADTKTDVGPMPEAKAGVKPEPKPEAKAEAKPEAKPEVKPGAKPAAKTEAKPETKAEAKTAPKAEAKPETAPKAEVKPETTPKAEAKPETKPAAMAETKPVAPIHEPEDTHTEAMPLPPALSPHSPRQLRPLPPPKVGKPVAPASAASASAASASAASASAASASAPPAAGVASKPDTAGTPEVTAKTAAEDAEFGAESSPAAVAATETEGGDARSARHSEPTEIVAPLPSPLTTDAPQTRRKPTVPHDATMPPVEETDQVVSPPRPRWLVPAIGGGLVVLLIVVIAIAGSGGDSELDATPEKVSVAEPAKPEPSAAPTPAPNDEVRSEAQPRTWANSQQAAAEPTAPSPTPEGSAAGSANAFAPEGTDPIPAVAPAPVEPDPIAPEGTDPVPVVEPTKPEPVVEPTKPEVVEPTKPEVVEPTKPEPVVEPTKPEKTKPEKTKPEKTKPEKAKPEKAKPAIAKPATTKPATKPATIAKTTKPAVKKPATKPKALPTPKWNPNTLLPNKK